MEQRRLSFSAEPAPAAAAPATPRTPSRPATASTPVHSPYHGGRSPAPASPAEPYHTGRIKAGAYQGTTVVLPSPPKDGSAPPASPGAREPHYSGRIVPGAQGRTRVIPSPHSPAAKAEEARRQQSIAEYHSGMIKLRTLGSNVIVPVPSPEARDAAVSAGGSPSHPLTHSPAKHPIRRVGDGATTASPAFDRERGLRAGPYDRPPAPVETGIIHSTTQGYTRVVPSPAKLAAAVEAGAVPASPSRGSSAHCSLYSSPIKSTRSGSTTAGSIAQQLANEAASAEGPLPAAAMTAPKGYLPHGTIRYVSDPLHASPEARYIDPESPRGKALIAETVRAKTSGQARTVYRSPSPTKGPIRHAFAGYTTVSGID